MAKEDSRTCFNRYITHSHFSNDAIIYGYKRNAYILNMEVTDDATIRKARNAVNWLAAGVPPYYVIWCLEEESGDSYRTRVIDSFGCCFVRQLIEFYNDGYGLPFLGNRKFSELSKAEQKRFGHNGLLRYIITPGIPKKDLKELLEYIDSDYTYGNTCGDVAEKISSVLSYARESNNAARALDLIRQVIENPNSEYCGTCEEFHEGGCPAE